MDTKRSVAEIFDEIPNQWGLRGDPFLWDELKEYFSQIHLPYSVNNLTDDIHRLFQEFVGTSLTMDCRSYVEKYAHGGMSNGYVCGEFWIREAIPLLSERLVILNSKF